MFATTPLEHWLATFTVPVCVPDVVVWVDPPDVVVPPDDGDGVGVPPDDWDDVGIALDVCVDVHPYDPGGRGPDVSAP